MEVKLIVEAGKSRGRTVRLHSEETIIGRRKDCDLRIPSTEVSRRHCVLSFRNGYLKVEDLDSINGTYLNGHRVVGKKPVRPGDLLEIGPVQFMVEYRLSREATKLLEREEAGEELEVFPAAEPIDGHDDRALDGEAEMDALPAEESDHNEQFQFGRPDQAVTRVDGADSGKPIPLEDPFEQQNWNLPPADDLRSLLSDMEDPNSKGRRGRKKEE